MWQWQTDEIRGTRHPLTYSFVPNLVWLPKQVALLTDRTGSFVPLYLQAIAHHLYRHAQVTDPSRRDLAERAWSLLGGPPDVPPQGLPDASSLNFFQISDGFMTKRLRPIRDVHTLLAATLGRGGERPRVSKRYNAAIDRVDPQRRRALHDLLGLYLGLPAASHETDPHGTTLT